MNKRARTLAFLLGAFLLCGCTSVPDRTGGSPQQPAETAESEEVKIYEETQTKRYPVDKAEFFCKLNAEGGVFTGEYRTDGEYYDGDGYVILDEGMTLSHIVEAEYSQHYRIILGAQSYKGAVIRLSTASDTVGYYYVPASETPEFGQLAVDCVYLPASSAKLNFECVSGSAALDYILVENADEVSPECYRTGTAAAAPNSSIAAIGTMKYLSDGYGKRIITAQNVTPATNAEIDAIYEQTGRYPAMRCGELALVTDKDSAERSEKELELALDWGRNGGLVSYTWHWYSPDIAKTVYNNETNFELSEALNGADLAQAALSDSEELKTQRENGLISAQLVDLINDIDLAAEALKPFCDEDIPVIWQPIPDGDDGLYWWGGGAESYKALWSLLFERMCSYHGLGNLVWVWNGSSADFRPNDRQFDIIGQTICEGSSASFAGRFEALATMPDRTVKPLAVTACDRLPKYDVLLRDNALWLWTAVGSGDVIINTDGTLSERLTDRQSLYDEYNSPQCITLDELPDLSEYALGE